MRSLRFVPVLFVVLVALLLFATPVFAAPAQPPGEEPAIPSLSEALNLLLTAGGLGIVISFVCEKRKWFQDLSPDAKMAVIVGLCIGIPLVAKLTLDFAPPGVLTQLDPYFKVMALGFLVSQWYHSRMKDTKQASGG